jgi:hypothetical protein
MQSDIGTQEYWNATAFAAAAAAAVADVAAAPQKDPVTLYEDDGGMYQGHVNKHGAKHGQGTLKTAIYITGLVGDENSHLMRWTEYSGNWDNGRLHGPGVMRKMSGNGVIQVVYDGMWCNGVPVLDDHHESDDDHEPEYDDAYYDRMEGSETPQRGDYDHSEEAS